MQYDALGLAELIRNKEVSETEILSCARQAAEQINPDINAIIELFDEPLSGCDNTDAPFYGVPFFIKDLVLHAKDILNEGGSRLAQGIKFEHDTALMQRFRQAGLRTLGRTASPEFGYCATTEPLVNGPSKNPWDLSRMPGGSSGASAAVVAAGIVPVAHANDGGGSIRIPASCCGLIGLKPSRGRISAGPDSAEGLSGFAIEFAVTRTVRDAARMLDAVHGTSAGDPFVIADPVCSYSEAINKTTRPLKIGFTPNAWSDVTVDKELQQAVLTTAKQCEALGHEVTEARPEFDWDTFLHANITIWTANIAFIVQQVAEVTGRPIDESTLEATTLACYQHGSQLSATDFLGAQTIVNQICRSVGAFFEQYDILLTPTVAQPPLPLGTLDANDKNLDAVGWSNKLFDFCGFTPLFNMTGQPAISLPLHRTSADLPLGVQFASRHNDEATLLQLARQFEQAHPWPQTAVLK